MHAASMHTGKTIATSIPDFRSSPNASDTMPTKVGPAVHPKSPASASKANIAVPPVGMFFAATLNVPGHISAHEAPQSATPASETPALGTSVTKRYAAIPTTADAPISDDVRKRLPRGIHPTLTAPITTANRHGPTRSPTVLLTPSPLSANADAHCATASSPAPAQNIMTSSTQNIPLRKRGKMRECVFSVFSTGMGTSAKSTALRNGIAAHIHAIMSQNSIPASENTSVDSPITATQPQQ